jgi:Xaa-Pro aminopeptidase
MTEKIKKEENTLSALARIQKELKAPKGQFNKFANFNYRSCEDILEAVKPLLEGCILTISDDIVLIGERYYVKATASLQAIGFQPFAVNAYARESEDKKGMDEAQITGASSSYARKYALNGLFAIDDTKDADVNIKRKVNNEKLLSGKELKDLAPVLQDINNAKTVEEIEEIGEGIRIDSEAKKYNDNQMKVLRQAYDGKKKGLK